MKLRLLFPVLAAAGLLGQPIDQGRRDFLLSALHADRKTYLDSVAGLSEAQWKFKPAPDRWSIAEIAEHVILTEDMLFGLEQKTLEAPAVAQPKSDPAADQAVLAGMTDRSHKAKNPPETGPTGQFATPRDAAQAFKERRAKTLDYARTTQDPLRAHAITTGFGQTDCYQILLMIAGHGDRHVAQINEVKADAQYPGK